MLYELLTGLPPYYSTDTDQIYNDILNTTLSFPNHKVKLSSDAKNLMSQLLQKDPSKRLGSKGGIREILSHPFFKGIDFKLLVHIVNYNKVSQEIEATA